MIKRGINIKRDNRMKLRSGASGASYYMDATCYIDATPLNVIIEGNKIIERRRDERVNNPARATRGLVSGNIDPRSIAERREEELAPIRAAVQGDREDKIFSTQRVRMIVLAKVNEDLNQGPNVIQMRRKERKE